MTNLVANPKPGKLYRITDTLPVFPQEVWFAASDWDGWNRSDCLGHVAENDVVMFVERSTSIPFTFKIIYKDMIGWVCSVGYVPFSEFNEPTDP